MMKPIISSLTRLGSSLNDAQATAKDLFNSCVITIRDDAGGLAGLRWPYALNDQGIYNPTKKRKGHWTGSYWVFPTTADAESILALLKKKFPQLPEIKEDGLANPEDGTTFCVIPVDDELSLCLLSRKLSYFTSIPGFSSPSKLFENNVVTGGNWPFPRDEKFKILEVFNVRFDDDSGVVAVLAPPETTCKIVEGITTSGATEHLALAELFQMSSRVRVSTAKWAVEVRIDLSNPHHWPLLQRFIKVENGWGKESTTRRKWGTWKQRISKAGLEWEGDDPDSEDITIPVSFNQDLVPGWNSPAPNGHLLHAYQKEGAIFSASRGIRALIGDEMGVGKTAQAIAAAEATSAERVIIICPANARYVWDREVQGWGGRGAIQHIESQLDKVDITARWHILTYDLVAARSESWRLNNDQEVREFIEAFPQFSECEEVIKGSYPRKVSLDQPLNGVPKFSDPKRISAWQKAMQRLNSELLEQILAVSPALVILDEAHRVKNRNTKRTRAIQRIAASEVGILMLTGTPLRNNEHEAAVLLSLLDANASKILSTKNGYTIQDVKDYLGYFMIRRTKEEVLPELPEKTRQRIDISELDAESMELYHEALKWADELYMKAIKDGKSEAEARQNMQGGIEKARRALGVAKVLGGEVVDLVFDVVQSKECCVIFCAHHDVSDMLKSMLEKEELQVAVVDGRTPQKKRAQIVEDFQSGRVDVFIGGINAAGEAITLTRADTVIFVELDWVPAALLQAEDRIHRVGQRSNCQVIQLVARTPEGNNLDEMMVDLIGSKVARIGAVLDEDTTNIISVSIQANVHDRLLARFGHENAGTPVAALPSEPNANIQMADQDPSAPATEKRRRGRPKVYVDKAPPTSTERSKRSIQVLAGTGGKRIMLRLTPEAHEALKVIMALTGGTQETATINQILIEQKNYLLRASP